MEDIIIADKVNIYYPKYHCIKNLSFKVKGGEIFSLLGPNGSGKTTVLRCLSTLIYPQSGKINIMGFSLPEESQKIRREIGVMFEGGIELMWRLTPKDMMEYYAALKLISRSDVKEVTKELLETVGLWEVRNKKIYQLSRGMKQKLHLAVALLSKPRLLLLDEPLLGLDIDTQNFFVDYIKKYAKQKNTVIIAGHYLHILEKISHKVLILKNGKKVIEGNIKNLMKRIKWRYKITITLLSNYYNYSFDRIGDIHIDPKNRKMIVYVRALNEEIFEEILKMKKNARDIDIRPLTLEEAYTDILGDIYNEKENRK